MASIYLDILDIFYGLTTWPSPVFSSMAPASPLITTLNDNPETYSSGIEWYTVSGTDDPYDIWYSLLWLVHFDSHDKIVATGRAHLDFAEQVIIPYCDHTLLVEDTANRSYEYISTWLQGGMDTDNDGLLDVEEVFWYNTNPLAWSTDGDILSDWQEITWGYDPLDTDNPIDAQELTYSAWQFGGTIGCVRANHYTAMDYVKVYVKYKNSLGYWTAYFYVGTDYTPTYYGDYYVSWSLLQGYVQMQVNVQAYDSEDHYLGSDQQYVTLPGGGGGGGGGDPVPE